jgi:hypothetical protein
LLGATLQLIELGLRLREQPRGALVRRDELLEGCRAGGKLGDRGFELGEKLF